MGNFPRGENTRLIASGGTEAAGFLKLSLFVAIAAQPLSGEVRHA
jgi:hypothetical protein